MTFFSFLKKAMQNGSNDLQIPMNWMPVVLMKRIHLHWTGGSYIASSLDKEHYHFLIEIQKYGRVRVVRGKFSTNANAPPLREGRYAAHTRRANSHAIGIGICGMAGASDRPLKPGDYPITKEQWNLAVKLIAKLAKRYSIEVTPTTVLTHAEVSANLKVRQRGKWDIAWLPFWKRTLSASDVGEKLREEVNVYV